MCYRMTAGRGSCYYATQTKYLAAPSESRSSYDLFLFLDLCFTLISSVTHEMTKEQKEVPQGKLQMTHFARDVSCGETRDAAANGSKA